MPLETRKRMGLALHLNQALLTTTTSACCTRAYLVQQSHLRHLLHADDWFSRSVQDEHHPFDHLRTLSLLGRRRHLQAKHMGSLRLLLHPNTLRGSFSSRRNSAGEVGASCCLSN